MLTYFAHSWINTKTGKYGIPVTHKEKYAKKNMFFFAYFTLSWINTKTEKYGIPGYAHRKVSFFAYFCEKVG